MRQITIRQLVRQSGSLVEWLPCEVTKDGEVIAMLLPPAMKHDVRQSKETKPKLDEMSDKVEYVRPAVSHQLYNYSADWKSNS